MTPSRFREIKEIVSNALDLPPADRSAFVMRACAGNAELEEQVERLLAASEKPALDVLMQNVVDEVFARLAPGCKTEASTETAMDFSLCAEQVIGGRFRIVRGLGKGGMGEVYEAEDRRLKDRVALKTIRPELASNAQAVERFKREILLGKRVTHPNVCRIHDLGVDSTADGRELLFLTMEFLRGETLSARIKRGAIPEAEALPIIEDLADALSAAHAAGVVHRDFKSGNVILVGASGGAHAVVTDFGLARALTAIPEGTPLSWSGAAAGTVAYMAPEQIEGKEVTHAADIYALGVVLYEMLTGKRPFEGESGISVAMKHLHEPPRPPRELTPQLNSNWNGVILTCLSKAPEDRYPSAAAVKAALVPGGTGTVAPSSQRRHARRKMVSAGVAGAILSIAAGLIFSIGAGTTWWGLPAPGGLWSTSKQARRIVIADVENRTGETVLDHTIRELLTSTLEQASLLKVFPSTELAEALRRMGRPPADELDTQLAIDLCQREGLYTAITGSITRLGSKYLFIVTAYGNRGEVIASVNQTADTQEQVIRAVEQGANALRRRLGESASSITATVPLERVTSPSLQAVQYYSLGRLQLYHGNAEYASDLFHRAIEIDPNFAMAHAYEGIAYEHLGDNISRRKELAAAVKLSDRVPEPERLKILGDYALAVFDFGEGVKYYRLLSQLRPDLAVAHLNLGQAYLGEFNFERALAETNAATRLEHGAGPEDNAVEILFLAGRTDEAMDRAARVLRSNAEDPRALYFLGRCHLIHGETETARGVFQRLLHAGTEGESMGHSALADLAMARERRDDARRELEQAMAADETAHNSYALMLRTLALEAMTDQSGIIRPVSRKLNLNMLQSDDRLLMLAAAVSRDQRDSNRLRELVAVLEERLSSRETPMLQSFLAMAQSALAVIENRREAAIASAQSAVQFENSTFAVENLGQVYAAYGMAHEAIAEFEKVLRRTNERMESYDGPAYHKVRELHQQLARLYRQTGDVGRANLHASLSGIH